MFSSVSLVRFLAVLALLRFVAAVAVPPLLSHQIEELTRRDDSDQSLSPRQNTNSSGFTVVTGIQGTSPQPRLEIRELQKNADQWNIYLLGMNRFMRTNESEKLSYYQIAGIHGRPYTPWDGVKSATGISSPGYCVHLSQLFLPWHRPYLALYEQILYSHIVASVNEFPSGALRTRYAQAAMSWRHPYWDWAAEPSDGGSVLPSSMTIPTVNVTMPNGTNTISNPLYAYRFHPVYKEDFYYDPWSSWNSTLRAPSDGSHDAHSLENTIGPILDNSRVSFRDRLYNLFTFYSNYSEFSTESYTFGTAFRNADSLESIHDVIHGATGSGGHMTYLDYSAYDPIFWLHHMMVDRVFALWQTINPDSYVKPTAAFQDSFTIPQGTILDGNTPLDPFHRNAKGEKWTSNSARSTKSFGYTYPELLNNASASSVKAAINKLYGSNVGNDSLLSKRFFDFGEPEEILSKRDSPPRGPPKRREYIANIVSDKFSCNGSYAVYIFLGTFNSSDPSCWPTQPNLVGTHAVFATIPQDATDDGHKARRAAMSGIQVTGTMPLTNALLEKAKDGEMRSMKPQHVEEYMANNLQYRVARFDGTEIPIAEVPNLSVSVIGADVTPATREDQFPRWANFQPLQHVTDNIGHRCA